MENKYTKTETSLIVWCISFAICCVICMVTFHYSREENIELKQKLEQCNTKN